MEKGRPDHPNREKTKSCSIHLTPSEWARFDNLKDNIGLRSRSELIRILLKKYEKELANEQNSTQGNC